MADKTLDRLLDAFLEASGGVISRAEEPATSTDQTARVADAPASSETIAGGAAPAPQAFEGASGEATSSAGIYEASTNPVGSNTFESPSSQASSSSGGTTFGSVATTFLESGFGIGALVEGLMGIFGGDTSSPAPLQKYEMPSAIDFDSAETDGVLTGADYGQSGTARSVGPGSSAADSAGGSTASSGQQITVNVQTMDAQSFMDNSSVIAQAVRGAMLNSSSINDVVSEL